MTAKGLIIVPTLGQVPTKAFMQIAYAKFPSFMGSAVALNDGTPEIVVSVDDKLPDLDTFLNILDQNKNDPMMLFLADTGKNKLSDESQQPFIFVKDAQGKDVVVGCMEGEYFAAKDADPKHTDEYHVSQVISMQLNRMFAKQCGSDMEKFQTELEDPATKQLIDAMAGSRGVVTLLTVLGKVFKYEKGNELSHEYPWAYVSQKLGYEEKPQDVATPATPGPKRGLLSLGKKSTPVIADTESLQQKKENGTSIAKANETATAIPDLAARPKIVIPDHLMKKGKAQISDWYKENDAQWYERGEKPPEGYKDRKIEVYASDVHLAKHAEKYGKLSEQLERMKARLNPDLTYRAFSPIITPKMKSIVNELLESGAVKAKTDTGKLLNPDELKEAPNAAPFSQQIGVTYSDTLRWDREIKKRFIDACLGVTCNEEKVMPIILAWEQAQLISMGVITGDKPVTLPADETDDKPDETDDNKTGASPVAPAPTKKGGLLGLGKKQLAAA
jgi:hypothetical protein